MSLSVKTEGAQPDLWNGSDSTGMDTRLCALAIIESVLGEKKPLDQILESQKVFLALPPRDRAFVRMLVATVLRRLGQIDDLIMKAVTNGQDPRPDALKHTLRLGIAQILFMDVPDHAAVDTSVRLAERLGLSRQKGFVNALLRRMTAEGKEWQKRQDEARLNVPSWIFDQWVAAYGENTAHDIAQANLAEAPLDLSVKNTDHRDEWAKRLEAAVLSFGTLRRPSGGAVQDLPGFGDGEWWVQDASAAMAVKLFGDVKGKTVVDLCAAPGGKTAQLAASGAHVIAVDRAANRLHRLQENMRRLRLEDKVEVVVSDATVWQPRAPVDCVLLDAPCTATGTIRRHPDVQHLKTPADQSRLVDVQMRLLDNAARIVRPGGTLIYCTCSLQRAEGEDQVDAFLKRHALFERMPVASREITGIKGVFTEAGDLRILPFHIATQGGMDGFYIARMKKI